MTCDLYSALQLPIASQDHSSEIASYPFALPGVAFVLTFQVKKLGDRHLLKEAGFILLRLEQYDTLRIPRLRDDLKGVRSMT